MKKKCKRIAGHDCFIYDCGSSDMLMIQPVGEHNLDGLDAEVEEIIRLTDDVGFTFAAFCVDNWNDDLSPWEAPAVIGDRGFAGHAEKTLDFIVNDLLPELTDDRHVDVYVGGYSLAGLFVLWAAYRTDLFGGVAGVSPSVWFPDWIEFVENNSARANKVYLSLGDREEKTRNPAMKTVGDNIRSQYELLRYEPLCSECVLEMNRGGHFVEPELRTARGFAWLLQ